MLFLWIEYYNNKAAVINDLKTKCTQPVTSVLYPVLRWWECHGFFVYKKKKKEKKRKERKNRVKDWVFLVQGALASPKNWYKNWKFLKQILDCLKVLTCIFCYVNRIGCRWTHTFWWPQQKTEKLFIFPEVLKKLIKYGYFRLTMAN